MEQERRGVDGRVEDGADEGKGRPLYSDGGPPRPAYAVATSMSLEAQGVAG